MRAAIYARVSTPRQARDLKIDQQVARLERYVQRKGWSLDRERVYLDEGYSGVSLNRPGLATPCATRRRWPSSRWSWSPLPTDSLASTSTRYCSSKNCRGAAVG